MKTLQLKAFGKPTTAPELIESDPPKPAPGQVLVALEAAPINPSDLLLIRGRYGHRPALPAALGTNGGDHRSGLLVQPSAGCSVHRPRRRRRICRR